VMTAPTLTLTRARGGMNSRISPSTSCSIATSHCWIHSGWTLIGAADPSLSTMVSPAVQHKAGNTAAGKQRRGSVA
jgi:hypothetical protein